MQYTQDNKQEKREKNQDEKCNINNCITYNKINTSNKECQVRFQKFKMKLYYVYRK